jgi:acetoacetyl-CoA synthetase
MYRFTERLCQHGLLTSFEPSELYRWSITDPNQFWREVWRECDLIASHQGNTVLQHPTQESTENKLLPCIPGYTWFPEARLNFAENLLRYRDDQAALIFRGEGQVRRVLSYKELFQQVSSLAASLRERGVGVGSRVAAIVANSPEAVIGMLAAASIGAIWSSCSPDFGTSGILDRFGQIEPTVLICCDGYLHKGKEISIVSKVREIVAALPSLSVTLVYHYAGSPLEISNIPNAERFEEHLQQPQPLSFEQLPFNHPLYIMYSSGTTGKPKCITHSAGGTLLEHLKELKLHVDLRRSDRIFYQTTCGWMMWNLLVSSLAIGATVVLYDGSPLESSGSILFNIADEEQLTIFGTNAKFLAELEKAGIKPRTTHQITNLHTVLSTGSVLAPESFDYVYRDLKSDVLLGSISGGTDIIGCFALSTPMLPVRRSELQIRSLGLSVDVVNERGESVIREKGELICRAPFPSMPVGFWNDTDGAKYRTAYFERFPGVWHHGDYVELRPEGGLVFYGRSDATLKPGGVRIGTAEIYRQVEQLPEILESIVIGQEWRGDTRIVLFVRLRDGVALTAELEDKIRRTIRSNASPFHVPKKILTVSEIPRTRSGKIVELAVRDVVHGVPVKNTEALANPGALEDFRGRSELSVD